MTYSLNKWCIALHRISDKNRAAEIQNIFDYSFNIKIVVYKKYFGIVIYFFFAFVQQVVSSRAVEETTSHYIAFWNLVKHKISLLSKDVNFSYAKDDGGQ